jgi:polysaccharide biosynthesis protein PelA
MSGRSQKNPISLKTANSFDSSSSGLTQAPAVRDSLRPSGIMTAEGSQYGPVSQNRAEPQFALPANGGYLANKTKKVEKCRHAVMHRHPQSPAPSPQPQRPRASPARVLAALVLTFSGSPCLRGAVTTGSFRPRPVSRVILAIYDSRYQKDISDTRIHRLLEMPLNHLGLIVRYQDRNTGLPSLAEMQDVRGILTWFQSDTMKNPAEFLAWAETAIDAGKRFVVIGDLSVSRNLRGQSTQTELINHFLGRIGLRTENWTPVTYDVRIVYKDPEMMDFERSLPPVLPPFDKVKLIDPHVRAHLVARRGNDPATDSPLITTGPHGGYVANGYTHFATYPPPEANSQSGEVHLQWYLNPFEFFRLAFATGEVPKLDTTTIVGRRIYYSHIDGDGWRNQTEVPKYRREGISSAEVILRETIKPFPDLPVTVGPIAGDLDPRWLGNQESIAVAKEILALPWVEAGSHTYSHPLDWETLAQLARGNVAKHENLWGSCERIWRPLWERVAEQWSKPEIRETKAPDEEHGGKEHASLNTKLRRGQSRLRSYDLYPFDADQEIRGSIEFINRLLPAGKRVKILQWSGTTLGSESIIQATRKAGVRNINGGDTRFDKEFDSYAWVAPLGRQVGRFHQIYSSDSNENTYTNLWNERYFGFRYLLQTLRRTESPIRVKPFNLYYHMFSGEKEPGLDALLGNLRFARSQELAPITASHYAAIVDGFYSGNITQIGNRRWRVENRDGLDTVRFDRADRLTVNWADSHGVLGERHYQGSLYVALDPADEAPVFALTQSNTSSNGGFARPYLVQSRWIVSRLRIKPRSFSFEAQGFGAGEMEWQTAPGTHYLIRCASNAGWSRDLHSSSSPDGRLRFSLTEGRSEPIFEPLEVTATESGARR